MIDEVKLKKEASKEITNFVKGLSKEDQFLIVLCNELYDSEFDSMKADLNERLKGEPFIYKLVDRIERDIKGVENIQEFEKKHKINIFDFVEGV